MTDAIDKKVDSLLFKPENFVDLSDYCTFVNNMIMCSEIVEHTERLLELAVENSHGSLNKYFKKHLEEEKDHYKWLIEDLSSIGFNKDIHETNEFSKEIISRQENLIKSGMPFSFLGYMYVLERNPLATEYVDFLESVHGKELTRTLRVHSDNDPFHKKELQDIINDNPLNEIYENAVATGKYLVKFLEKLTSLRR